MRGAAALGAVAMVASLAGYGLGKACLDRREPAAGAAVAAVSLEFAAVPRSPPELPKSLPAAAAADMTADPQTAAGGGAGLGAEEESLPEETDGRLPAEHRASNGSDPHQLAALSTSAAAFGPAEAPAWRRNAALSPDTSGRPAICIVLDDLGIDGQRTARAIALPPPLTLSFLADARNLPALAEQARARGHELLVHVGMEPAAAAADPGSHALFVAHTAGELRQRLHWNLSRFDGYVGISNHMGSRFTADPKPMSVVLAEVGRRGLLFLDSRTTAETVAARTALALDVAFAQRNVFLDAVGEEVDVEARLQQTERFARRNGFAVAIGHPRDATLDALATWLPTLAGRGYAQVPLTAVVSRSRNR
jgi:hypothetical protein